MKRQLVKGKSRKCSAYDRWDRCASFRNEHFFLEEESSFLQLWFKPERKQLTPSYENISYDLDSMKNVLLPIVSSNPTIGATKIHSDVTLYLSKLETGKEIFYQQGPGRKMYVFVIEGELLLNNVDVVRERDSARITEQNELTLKSTNETFFLLIDLGGE